MKVFVTQGGMQSIEEAIYSHVPVVVMPKISDQFFNAKRAKNKGMGLTVDFDTLTKESFKEAILEVANNPKCDLSISFDSLEVNQIDHFQISC